MIQNFLYGENIKNIKNLESIFTMLKAYDLANSTPMQGLHFIQQLKNELNKREKNNGEI